MVQHTPVDSSGPNISPLIPALSCSVGAGHFGKPGVLHWPVCGHSRLCKVVRLKDMRSV